ncbi:Angiotensin-converting enzyme [Pseudolycoriella hygida]|uniref:Angiotensin-converting enzyme n=1 Tax=Pseudolycoriella hygida TaxID=35572 RepID=A0A9Q0RXZ2_9DIPT|nr:Angiotensin-converting enzyme [Pseudolycoriella hygida]
MVIVSCKSSYSVQMLCMLVEHQGKVDEKFQYHYAELILPQEQHGMFRALMIGILLMILGAGMATIGYYAEDLSIGQEVRGNTTVRIKNESRGFHLNNLSYAGPIVMGFGGFIIVAACVMTFEARDSAAKVVPARFKLSTTNCTTRTNSSSRRTTDDSGQISTLYNAPKAVASQTSRSENQKIFSTIPFDAAIDRQELTATLTSFSKAFVYPLQADALHFHQHLSPMIDGSDSVDNFLGTQSRTTERTKRSDTAKRHVLSRQKPIQKDEQQIPSSLRKRTSDVSHLFRRCSKRQSLGSKASENDSFTVPTNLSQESAVYTTTQFLKRQISVPFEEREFRSQLSINSEPETSIRTLSCQSSLEPFRGEESVDLYVETHTFADHSLPLQVPKNSIVEPTVFHIIASNAENQRLKDNKQKSENKKKEIYRSNSSRPSNSLPAHGKDDTGYDSIEVIDERRNKNFEKAGLQRSNTTVIYSELFSSMEFIKLIDFPKRLNKPDTDMGCANSMPLMNGNGGVVEAAKTAVSDTIHAGEEVLLDVGESINEAAVSVKEAVVGAVKNVEPLQNADSYQERWCQKVNDELLTINRYTAFYAWELSLNATPKLSHDSVEFNKVKCKWLNSRCSEAAQLPENVDETFNRMMDLLCRSPKFSEMETEVISTLLFNMQQIFTETEICLPKSLDLCLNANQIWEYTYVKYPDDSFHRIILQKDSAHSHQIHSDVGIVSDYRDSFQCFSGEPDLERIMQGDFSKLDNGNCVLKFNEIFRWAWESWRLAVGNKIGDLYPTLVQYMNFGAKNNGYQDIGESWREEVDIPNLRDVVNSLNDDIKPFYELLHGVLRNLLWERVHKFEPFLKNETIPAHLLGSMWAQNWKLYLKLISPFNEVDLDENFMATNWTNIDMVKHAEDYYSSMGLPRMTKLFWEKSLFRNRGNGLKCHGTAANMFSVDDFRMIVCAERTLEDFYVIVHEMGHIQYYMAYQNQPAIFREANSAMQESIGDALYLGIMTPQHLNRIKLLPDKYLFTEKLLKFAQPFENMIHSHKANNEFKDFPNDNGRNGLPSLIQFFGKTYPDISDKVEKMQKFQNFTSHLDGSMNSFDLSLLLRQALTQIPQIPFAYMLDIFRWDLFSRDVSFDDANNYFWKLAKDQQGIHPPDYEDRTHFFDPGAKFHVADNTPYVRYFLANFIQAQIFHGLCRATVFGEFNLEQKLPMPLHRCDLYGSKRAGKLLKKALQIGASQPWTETLFILTGSRKIKADSLLLYYAPLIEWLEKVVVAYDIPIVVFYLFLKKKEITIFTKPIPFSLSNKQFTHKIIIFKYNIYAELLSWELHTEDE